jgi:ABC-type transport system involved in multi-copper enzyme maturation permease subunit
MTSPLRRLLSRDANPILIRELRSLLRGRLYVWFLTIATLALGLLVFTVGAIEIAGDALPSSVGQILFHLFFIVAFLVFGIVAPTQSASSITSEREQRTLEGIILTGLSPRRIVWGKFVASVASMFMVLIAFLPVAGIAVLFGGISPLHVVVGYAALLLLLLPASGYGLALSAHLRSSRVSTTIAALTAVVGTIGLLIALTALGDLSIVRSGGGFGGPFFFVDFLLSRALDLETMAGVVAATVTLVGFPTWFLLAAALSAVRPASHDRVGPFKVWALALVAWGLLMAVALMSARAPANPTDIEELGLSVLVVAGLVEGFFALVFVNEPVLAPSRSRAGGLGARIAGATATLGPGAAPTLRFSILLIVGTAAAAAAAVLVTRDALIQPADRNPMFEEALFAVALGTATAALALVAFGALVRVLTRRGIAARLLAIAALAIAILVPLFVLALAEPMRAVSRHLPVPVLLSPIFPPMLAGHLMTNVMTAWRWADVVPQAVMNTALALVFWALVEHRAWAAARAARAAEAERDERARASVPSMPLLQVARSSLVPAAPRRDGGGGRDEA